MRCFLAVELPEHALLTLQGTGRAIRRLDPGWAGEKWAATGVLHVTLKFLGELDEAAAQRIEAEFAAAAAERTAFELAPSGLRAVPNERRTTMIWCGLLDPSGGCASLAQTADAVAQRHGVSGDSRRFTPHVTLVRARRPRGVEADTLARAERESGLSALKAMSVPSASLFASTLTPNGPIHERLSEFVFGAGQGR